ncbi:hypothetical protein SDC9_128513 [bioreactor metagenome]|uniref:Uncharacterized protein n=1 Tax=bioreactor metagenome TaxID=1076179 RepID=A0A645CWC8_9ZZZZ
MAADLVRRFQRAAVENRVCHTSTAAIVFCPAIFAGVLCADVAAQERFLQIASESRAIERAEFVILHADELMAGIDIPFRRDGDIFRACAAAVDAFTQARTAVGIKHKVEEVKPRAGVFPCFNIVLRQRIIFRVNSRQMLRQ